MVQTWGKAMTEVSLTQNGPVFGKQVKPPTAEAEARYYASLEQSDMAA